MAKDVTRIMQDDDHSSHRQLVTEEVPKEEETGHSVVQEHLLEVATSLTEVKAAEEKLDS